jgi:hypothetical protein
LSGRRHPRPRPAPTNFPTYSTYSYRHLRPQKRHSGSWTQIVPPHPGQVHLSFSLPIKRSIPSFPMFSRFSIMLIPYVFRYRASRCRSLPQGKLSQSRQYPSTSFSQFLIWQATRVFGLTLSSPLHPGHASLPLAYARQSRQFIPQGAISPASIKPVFAICPSRTQTVHDALKKSPLLFVGFSAPTLPTAHQGLSF